MPINDIYNSCIKLVVSRFNKYVLCANLLYCIRAFVSQYSPLMSLQTSFDHLLSLHLIRLLNWVYVLFICLPYYFFDLDRLLNRYKTLKISHDLYIPIFEIYLKLNFKCLSKYISYHFSCLENISLNFFENNLFYL